MPRRRLFLLTSPYIGSDLEVRRANVFASCNLAEAAASRSSLAAVRAR